MTLSSADAAVLLGRPNRSGAVNATAEELRDARVLITGAGGLIGASLSRALAGNVAALTLLDHHEHSLHDLVLELGGAFNAPSFVLGDVRDQPKMRRIVERDRPTHIFHLAAYKHVPFGQLFPEETVSVNVVATRQLLDLSIESGVGHFIYPSSDKAVNPPSLYGATKRISEVATQQTALTHKVPYGIVRYVNVLGTRGSVIETFSNQLADGQALSVTSAEMTRYWMTMDEAVWLLLVAATSLQPADILMLAELHEISVLDMARRLSGLLGYGCDPEVRVIGIRPGERLREELLSANESFVAAVVDGIARVEHAHRESQLQAVLPRFEDILEQAPDELTSQAMDLARQLQ